MDGEAVATWKRTMRASTVRVDIEAISTLSKKDITGAEQALARYAAFIGRELVLSTS